MPQSAVDDDDIQIIENPHNDDPLDMYTIVVHKDIPHSYHQDAGESYYSLSQIPLTAVWDEGWHPTTLANEQSPIRIRAIGCLHQLSYNVSEGVGPITAVDIELLRPIDHDAFIRLLAKARPRPQRYPQYMHLERTWDEPQTCFKDAYDATHLLRPPKLLKTLPITAFVPGDIVAIDTVCLKVPGELGTRIHFELLTMYLITPIPRVVHDYVWS
ncbi:hypothetical protein FKP32DRAFT_1674322 [Trametes sanguinea]|nr:hypothetical protein FKP32DRAFT_1674322 [Trametes sanguinea]